MQANSIRDSDSGAGGRPAEAPLAGRLAGSLLGAVLPVALMFARHAPAALVPAAALLALAGALARHPLAYVRARLRAVATSREGLILAAFIVWAAASAAWAPAPGAALVQLAKFAALMLAGLGLVAFALNMFPARLPLWRGRSAAWETVIVAAAFLAAVLLVVLLARLTILHVSFRRYVEPDLVRLNGPAIVLINYAWLAAAVLLARRRRLAAAALFVVLAAGVFASESQSAMVGLAASGLAAAAFALMPRLAPAAFAGGLFAVFFAAPLLLGNVDGFLPAAVFELLRHGNADIRAGIWYWDLQIVREVWAAGIGFNMSHLLPASPLVQALPAAGREALNAWHPHSAPIQVWVELGIAGALLYAALVASAAARIGELPAASRPYVAAAAANMAVVTLVGYGAWESWWVAAQVSFAALAIGQARLAAAARPG